MTTGSRQPRPPIEWSAIRARLERAEAGLAEALEPSPERGKAIMDERARLLSQESAPALAPGASIGVIEFGLGKEHYAIEVAFVREVVRLVHYTVVPGVPEYIVGVTNLRGLVLPIVDLRRFFNIATKGLSDQSRVIVLGAGQVEFGVLADEAYGQLELGADDILTPPGELPGIGRSYLRGVTRDAVVILNGATLIADDKFFIRETR